MAPLEIVLDTASLSAPVVPEGTQGHPHQRQTDLVRIPVAVKDDHGVRCLQVQAQAARSGAQQKDEILGPGLVEFLQQRSAVLRLGGSWG